MNLTTTAFADGAPIPAEFAFGAIDPATHVRLSGNRNPDFAWTGVPAGTKSLALICHDPDVPSRQAEGPGQEADQLGVGPPVVGRGRHLDLQRPTEKADDLRPPCSRLDPELEQPPVVDRSCPREVVLLTGAHDPSLGSRAGA